MPKTPEKGFMDRVHNRMDPATAPHYEKNHNAYRGGTPDMYYSGHLADLWVEYKFQEKAPKYAHTLGLSPLQLLWIKSRRLEGRDVWVILGTKNEGGFVFTSEDEIDLAEQIPIAELRKRHHTLEAISQKIARFTGYRLLPDIDVSGSVDT